MFIGNLFEFDIWVLTLSTAGVGSLSRTKSQQATSLSAAHKLVNFSSFRIAKPSPSPLRRNTTRGARGTSQNTVRTSDNSLRQLSVDPTLLHSAPDTRNTSPNLSEGNLRSVSMNFNNTASEHGRWCSAREIVVKSSIIPWTTDETLSLISEISGVASANVLEVFIITESKCGLWCLAREMGDQVGASRWTCGDQEVLECGLI